MGRNKFNVGDKVIFMNTEIEIIGVMRDYTARGFLYRVRGSSKVFYEHELKLLSRVGIDVKSILNKVYGESDEQFQI